MEVPVQSFVLGDLFSDIVREEPAFAVSPRNVGAFLRWSGGRAVTGRRTARACRLLPRRFTAAGFAPRLVPLPVAGSASPVARQGAQSIAGAMPLAVQPVPVSAAPSRPSAGRRAAPGGPIPARLRIKVRRPGRPSTALSSWRPRRITGPARPRPRSRLASPWPGCAPTRWKSAPTCRSSRSRSRRCRRHAARESGRAQARCAETRASRPGPPAPARP